MKVLVTGAAGFIGSKLAYYLAKRGDDVVGIDNINDYYDVHLKYGRLAKCGFRFDESDMPFGVMFRSDLYANMRFIRMSIDEKKVLDELFERECFDKVVNLAAQAGVRYSITNPYSYMQSNFVGFLNILEACRNYHIQQLVFASSSSVYGMNTKIPFNENDKVDTPVSLYAASKKSNELMAHSYSKLYGLKVIGLRYFTVYGPWGRPDMAPMLFANAIRKSDPIKVFNNGDMVRDFTYIDDIVEGTIRVLDYDINVDDCPNHVAYKIFNIGGGHPTRLMDFITELERAFGKPADKIYLPMQPGDVYLTSADVTKLKEEVGYNPQWTLQKGVKEFVRWFNSYQNPLP